MLLQRVELTKERASSAFQFMFVTPDGVMNGLCTFLFHPETAE